MRAAWPDRTWSLRIADLPFRGLATWLRERLAETEGALTSVLLAYDAGRNLERLPATAREDPPLPDLFVARYPAWQEADVPEGPWTTYAASDAPPEAAERLEAWLDTHRDPGPPLPSPAPTLTSSMAPEAYERALSDVLEGIAAGELYQANVARRLEAPLDPACVHALHARLQARSPADFAILHELGEGRWISSISPECLLHYDALSRGATSFPIKGTRPRHADPRRDRDLTGELAADPKERAEHVMIVDLVRHDLGRVAEPGSVEVHDLFAVHSLPTVHHMISEVRARVAAPYDLPDVLAALFPGGSISGAPKIAAMERIERVEGLRRGYYTGSFGLVRPDGSATFNILIRTCTLAGGRLLYATGGGIVADSEPAAEWRETEHKARALVEALQGPHG